MSVDTRSRSEETNAVSCFGGGEQSYVVVRSILSTPIVVLSEESEPYVYSEDNPDYLEIHGLGLEESNLDNSEPEDELSPPKKTRPNYDLTRKFQMVWAAQCPWAEMKLTAEGLLHVVCCRTCTNVGKKEVVMGPRLNTLKRHAKRKSHKANMLLFAAKHPTIVLQQINHCNSIESKGKRVQFATLFQVLSDRRPMLEFESRSNLYSFLGLPNLPSMHWSDNFGWIMAAHMYSFEQQKMKAMIIAADFIAITCENIWS